MVHDRRRAARTANSRRISIAHAVLVQWTSRLERPCTSRPKTRVIIALRYCRHQNGIKQSGTALHTKGFTGPGAERHEQGSASADRLLPAFKLRHAGRRFTRSTFADHEPVRIDKFNDALASQWDLGEVKERHLQRRRRRRRADVDCLSAQLRRQEEMAAACRSSMAARTAASPPTSIIAGTCTCSPVKGYVVACINFHGSSRLRPKVHRFDHRRHGDQAVHRRHEGDRLDGSASRTSTRIAWPLPGAATAAS